MFKMSYFHALTGQEIAILLMVRESLITDECSFSIYPQGKNANTLHHKRSKEMNLCFNELWSLIIHLI